MKCDHCENEATVHEVVVHNGHKVEKHLCEECATEAGINVEPGQPIQAILQKFSVGGKPAPASCPGCGLTYNQFRQKGLLGCPRCYEAFEQRLGPLLERAQEGGSHHIGKAPRRAGSSVDRQQRASALRQELQEALAAEHYERAAALRDALRDMSTEPSGGSAPRRDAGDSRGAEGGVA